MKKENRIRKSREFQSIMSEKHYASSAGVVIYVAPRKLDHARFGISVSKKMGNAVQRNKFKRQLRMMLQEMDVTSARYDAIVIARRQFSVQSFQENKKDLESCLKKVKIIEESHETQKEIIIPVGGSGGFTVIIRLYNADGRIAGWHHTDKTDYFPDNI